jgi:hypothetical protein
MDRPGTCIILDKTYTIALLMNHSSLLCVDFKCIIQRTMFWFRDLLKKNRKKTKNKQTNKQSKIQTYTYICHLYFHKNNNRNKPINDRSHIVYSLVTFHLINLSPMFQCNNTCFYFCKWPRIVKLDLGVNGVT